MRSLSWCLQDMRAASAHRGLCDPLAVIHKAAWACSFATSERVGRIWIVSTPLLMANARWLAMAGLSCSEMWLAYHQELISELTDHVLVDTVDHEPYSDLTERQVESRQIISDTSHTLADCKLQ